MNNICQYARPARSRHRRPAGILRGNGERRRRLRREVRTRRAPAIRLRSPPSCSPNSTGQWRTGGSAGTGSSSSPAAGGLSRRLPSSSVTLACHPGRASTDASSRPSSRKKTSPPPGPSAPGWSSRGPLPTSRARTAACSTEDHLRFHSCAALLRALGTTTRRTMRFPDAERTVRQTTDPTRARSRAFDLLGVYHLP